VAWINEVVLATNRGETDCSSFTKRNRRPIQVSDKPEWIKKWLLRDQEKWRGGRGVGRRRDKGWKDEGRRGKSEREEEKAGGATGEHHGKGENGGRREGEKERGE